MNIVKAYLCVDDDDTNCDTLGVLRAAGIPDHRITGCRKDSWHVTANSEL